MLTRVVILLCLATTSLASDSDRELHRKFLREWRREEKRHKALAAQPTPPEWRLGAVWRFVTTQPSGERDVLAFRITNQRTTTCTGVIPWKDIWYKLVVVEGHIPTEAAYQIEGRALLLDLSAGVCDVGDIVDGVLSGDEFTGVRGRAKVHGSLVRP